MDLTLQNKELKVRIATAGAELRSVVTRRNDMEYMWSGDPAVWGKTSPILFPIVGTLVDGKYAYEGNVYNLPRHGFARDNEFAVASVGDDQVIFLLESNGRFLDVFPFEFALTITYSIDGMSLTVSYGVENRGSGDMYFSLGAHPAFAVPLVAGTRYEDYYLLFNTKELANRWPITREGLISPSSTAFLVQSNRVDLTHALFEDDAVVLKELRSKVVSLRCNEHPHGLDFHFEGFRYLGIWSARHADFVCIEPWCGIADTVGHSGQLVDKEGIERLAPKASWSRSWVVTFY
jgi:galactose mutarotase-like enzyme